LNNKRQSIGPRPDSRPRLEGARYKYPTNCSRLLSPTSPFSHAHTRTHHQPDSSPPWLAQWACYKKASATSAYGSRVGWTPARRNNNNNKVRSCIRNAQILFMAHRWCHYEITLDVEFGLTAPHRGHDAPLKVKSGLAWKSITWVQSCMTNFSMINEELWVWDPTKFKTWIKFLFSQTHRSYRMHQSSEIWHGRADYKTAIPL